MSGGDSQQHVEKLAATIDSIPGPSTETPSRIKTLLVDVFGDKCGIYLQVCLKVLVIASTQA